MRNRIESLVGKMIAAAYWDGQSLFLYTEDDEIYECYKRQEEKVKVSYKGGAWEFTDGFHNLCYSKIVSVSFDSYSKNKGFWTANAWLTIVTEMGEFSISLSRYNYRAHEQEHRFELLFAQDAKVHTGEDAYKLLGEIEQYELWRDFDKNW